MMTIHHRVLEYIKNSFANPDEDAFNRLALEVFSCQYTNIPIYQKLCDKRGADPDRVSSWRDILGISTEAFKLFELFSRPATEAQRSFSTSGTTRGNKKGRSLFSAEGLELMDAAILENARRCLFPDSGTYRFLIIAPPPEKAPHMIMAYGMEQLKKNFGRAGSRFLIGESGFIPEELAKELKQAEQENTPVALIGASLGFLSFFDFCAQQGLLFNLPQGSRTLDAGGYKGRGRTIAQGEFISLGTRFLGVPSAMSINLLGMTELGSQFYDNALKNKFIGSPGARCKENPPWTRTRVLDPRTMQEVPVGAQGVLWHLDLTNLERVAVIQTDDIGRRCAQGFEILGRARGSEARGCSLSIEEITGKS
jgi:anaerobic magnesium-protoporphyrin IX monomethyl ester cyclase